MNERFIANMQNMCKPWSSTPEINPIELRTLLLLPPDKAIYPWWCSLWNMALTRPWSTARAAAASTWPPSLDTPPSWPTLSPRDRWGEPEETKAENSERFSWLFSSHRVSEFERDSYHVASPPPASRGSSLPLLTCTCLSFAWGRGHDGPERHDSTYVGSLQDTQVCMGCVVMCVCLEVPNIGTCLDSVLTLIWLGDFIFHIFGLYNLYIAHPFLCCLYHLNKTKEERSAWCKLIT